MHEYPRASESPPCSHHHEMAPTMRKRQQILTQTNWRPQMPPCARSKSSSSARGQHVRAKINRVPQMHRNDPHSCYKAQKTSCAESYLRSVACNQERHTASLAFDDRSSLRSYVPWKSTAPQFRQNERGLAHDCSTTFLGNTLPTN